MDLEFHSLEELYLRIRPALESKVSELHKIKYNYIKEEDIWNCLKETKWKNARNLLLFEMVDDIINIEPLYLDEYLKTKMASTERIVYLKEDVSNDNV